MTTLDRQSGTDVAAPSMESMLLLARLARALESRVDELAARLVIAIRLDPNYGDHSVVPDDDLDRSLHENLLEALGSIAGIPAGLPATLHAAAATGVRRAKQRLPLESLLHAYRLGGRVIWEGVLEEAGRTPDVSVEVLMNAAVLVWDIIDLQSDEVAAAYRRAEAALAGRDELRRLAALNTLLSGVATESDLRFAIDVLGLRETGPYVVALAYDQGDRGEALAAALAGRGVQSRWLRRDLWLLGLIVDCTDRSLWRRLGEIAGRRMGLSPPAADLASIATAYRQADLALRAIPADHREIASLDDHLTGALLVASPDLARRLRRRVLGPVLDLPATESSVLLRTLRIFVEVGGSASAAAQRIPCHRNTVLNRVRRVQELTETSLSDPHQLAQLVLALEASDVLGLDEANGHRE